MYDFGCPGMTLGHHFQSLTVTAQSRAGPWKHVSGLRKRNEATGHLSRDLVTEILEKYNRSQLGKQEQGA